MAKAKKKAKSATTKRAKRTYAERLAATDVDQYNTERMFAAEKVARDMLEGTSNVFDFGFNEHEEAYGSCELAGVDDARDEQGIGGAWVSVKIFIPNLDIDTEINRGHE